jgi:hypothetical protein
VRRGRSNHQIAADLLAEKWAQTADGAKRLALSYLMTRDERLSHRIDMMGQPYQGWDMGQLFALSCLMHMYGLGFLSITEIPLDAAPMGDRQRERNSRVLSNVMDGVVAEVDLEQRGAEGDGHVQWDFALPAVTTLGEEEGIVYVDPGTARLEIGHTDASNTCLHLARFGAIARWPYEQEFLGILAMRPRNVISTWRSNRPARAVFADFAEFTDIMAATRLSRPLAKGMLDRPSAEERLLNARVSFGDIEELGKLVEKPDRLDCV